MHSFLSLPQELIDEIIDNLHDDGAALAACSLVANTWLPSSQRHLFQGITVHLKDGVIPPNRRMLDFQSFLQNSPRCRDYIRTLALVEAPGSSVMLDLPLLYAITSMLDHLRCLKLIRVSWPSSGASHNQCSHVREIVLQHNRIQDEADLWNFFEWFPGVTKLTLEVFQPIVVTPTRKLPAPSISLETLCLRFIPSQFLQGLLSTPSIHSLRCLDFGWVMYPYHLSLVGNLIDSAGLNLTDLRIGLQLWHVEDTDDAVFDDPYMAWAPLGIDRCTSLQSFTLLLDRDDFTVRPQFFTAAIDHIPSSIHSLAIGLDLSDESMVIHNVILPECDWARLDRKCAQMRNLRSVRFFQVDSQGYETCEPDGNVREIISTCLPGLQQRNILCFDE